jgi:predicted heme/steroid binding protein
MLKQLQLIKINRIAAWVLFFTILLYFFSGYGMTKGFIDRQLSLTLHQSILPFITFTAFIIHVSISIKYAFIRWKIWNPISKSIIIAVLGFIFLLFIYLEFFYQPTPVGNIKQNSINVSQPSSNQSTQKTFTASELSKYNGKNNNPAYVAVDGIVYDLTNVFINGTHFGYSAGQDLTNIFNAKHSKSQIEKYPVVGILK